MPELAGIRIEGISIGGIETCLYLPGLKLAFDIGRCPAEVVKSPTILFTHAHVDHMGGVVNHAATRALRHMPPPTYVVPHEDVEAFRDLFDVWRRLDRSDLEHHLVPLGPGEEHELGNDLVARPFHSPHRAPCQGYGLWRRRRKLKPEYRDLPGDEIRRLRVDENLEVTETLETPEVAFTGDAKIEVVEREAVVRTARVLIMEVTFVDDRVSIEQARAKGHIHLDEVAQRADLFENEALLLTHFSSRYKPDEILQALDRKLPSSLRERVTPLLVGL
ncbi:MAG: MBL fold metallo-hydrolase [Planctomycetota bacterium]|nr:MBL fold metallo-hydrolase [Planctomycetota bacterium]